MGSTPTGSIDNLHCFVNLSKTLFLQRFLFCSFIFLGNPFLKKDSTKDTTLRCISKKANQVLNLLIFSKILCYN